MKIDASIGEVVDKLTILSIKIDKFRSPDKLANVKKEYTKLSTEIEKAGIAPDSSEFLALKEVNQKLWNIEDAIRIKESKKEFDEEFIELARSVYFFNDERSDIKKQINRKFNSELIEEKEYVEYKNT